MQLHVSGLHYCATSIKMNFKNFNTVNKKNNVHANT